ncbi:heat shock factor protein 5 isoform X2 [Ascaphus truei]|uniref:heat shock factor protein 5 isoform X2 n=1 Tax=Ascaphus truei TaxID=8439 RepID=UPI003F59328C
MDVEEALLSTPINPNNFPAKLWRLVNSPRYQSIRWDLRGEGVIIDQQLFESELLCPSNPLDETNELFKTTNFTSFIRQLNLYGFRKVVMGVGGNPGLLHPGGDLGAGDGHLHHFHNIHFHKEHPDLLVNLKRLTSANKAKMAAGLEVNSRPPNRFQRLLSNSLVEQSPMTIGQLHRSFRRENLSPYPYVSATSHNHVAFPLKGLDRTPVPTRTWSNTLGLLPSQVESPSSFPDKGILFPVLQRLPTEVTYTLQPSPSSVHMQQGHAAMTGAAHKYSSYAPTAAQYPQAYYPTALLQCCSPPSHMEHLTGCSNPAASYQHCSYFQNPPMQSSYPMDYLHPNWPSNDSESKKGEVNLEAVFQIVDELHSSPKLEMVQVDTQEIQGGSPSQPVKDQQVPVTLASGSQLESLTPVVTDINSFVVGADQSIACSLSQASEYIYPIHSSQNEARLSSAADNMLDPKVSVKLDKELNQPSSELAMVLMEQGLSSSPLKVNMKNPRGASESTLPMEPMQFLVSDIVSDNKLGKDEIMARSRERRGTTKQGKSPDLHLLVDVACKQEQFPKEEELGE